MFQKKIYISCFDEMTKGMRLKTFKSRLNMDHPIAVFMELLKRVVNHKRLRRTARYIVAKCMVVTKNLSDIFELSNLAHSSGHFLKEMKHPANWSRLVYDTGS